MRTAILLASCLLPALPAAAGQKALVDTTRAPGARMTMVDLADARWTGGLWAGRFDTCRAAMIPHLWSIFSDDRASHAWANYLIAAGLRRESGDRFEGPPFNDGDFLKWVEALSQVYAVTRDPAIRAQLDRIIPVIAKAQRSDGYLDTQTIIPERLGDRTVHEFADREHFETYNMGHLMTAACIHTRATGETTLLACAIKAADYIDRLSIAKPAELALNAICPSHYMGVVELYRVTGDPRYLALAKRLITIRDLVDESDASDQNQDRVPVRRMIEAVGHAVRANYLYAGIADLMAEAPDPVFLRNLTALSDDVADRKLYVTGQTGALYDGASPDGSTEFKIIKPVHQAYGRPYQLPNLTAYNESCAAVGFVLWNWRMLLLTGDARYADLVERSLYNGVLPAVSLDGLKYFYTNPLKRLREDPVPLRWSRTREPNIPQSFCCPPNVVRTIAEAHNYLYTLSPGALWVNLYGASQLRTTWMDGARVALREDTDYPWSGSIRFTILEAPDRPFALRLRVPGWLREGGASLSINGRPWAGPLEPGAYAEVSRLWKAGDVAELTFAFETELLEANPLVEEALGQAAVRRGPLIYCLESQDLPAGVRLEDVALGVDSAHRHFAPEPISIGGVPMLALRGKAWDTREAPWGPRQLYRVLPAAAGREIDLTLIPYFAWDNRGLGDMSVWLPLR